MMWKPAVLLLFATSLLGACERYTEQISPCFGRDGEPVVSRAAYSPIAAPVTHPTVSAKNCDFEELPRPE